MAEKRNPTELHDLAIAWLPWPLRRLLFWLGLNLGLQVPNLYGSFGVSVLGSERVAIASVVAPWASFLNYGPITTDGDVEVLCSFRYRVVDGMAGAKAVQALERCCTARFQPNCRPA